MKIFKGKVVSLKMKNTAVVELERNTVHPLYRKVLKRSKKYKVEIGDASLSLGDTVKITETKPISKNKFFRLLNEKDKEKKEKR